jgi:hypothetical protein
MFLCSFQHSRNAFSTLPAMTSVTFEDFSKNYYKFIQVQLIARAPANRPIVDRELPRELASPGQLIKACTLESRYRNDVGYSGHPCTGTYTMALGKCVSLLWLLLERYQISRFPPPAPSACFDGGKLCRGAVIHTPPRKCICSATSRPTSANAARDPHAPSYSC